MTALGVGLVSVACGQSTMQFPVARDTSIDGWDGHDGYGDPPVFDKTFQTEEWANFGGAVGIRARKANQHGAIMDWDTDAINAFLNTNADLTQPVTWTFNLYPYQFLPTFDVTIETLESLNDWSEGDGGGIDVNDDGAIDENDAYVNFNWSPDTKAVTTNFAQTAYMLDDDGDRVLDVENSVPWLDNETGTGGIDDNQYSILGRADNWSPGLPVPDFENTELLLLDDILEASEQATYASVPLDNDLVTAILTDPNNRGILLGPKDNQSFDNWTIHSRESDGFGQPAEELPGPMAAFLEVTYTPRTAPNGDFNASGALDGGDIDDLTTQSAGGTNPATYDLNADTLVNEGDVNVWVKDLFNSWIGDANLDGEFNSTDLVNVLASGTYEADVASVWTTGDFNGDGRTNSSDLVAALADGGYELGPRGATAAVPEPATLTLLAMGLLASFGCGRRYGRR
jgi:hypothetical protein